MKTVWLFALLGLAGCQSKEGRAREEFSKEHTCPADRVEVRERADVKNSMTYAKHEPPADIAADPGRLAMWKAEQEKNLDYADNCDMFEARGCGKQSLLCCHRSSKHLDRVSCSTRPYANGISRW